MSRPHLLPPNTVTVLRAHADALSIVSIIQRSTFIFYKLCPKTCTELTVSVVVATGASHLVGVACRFDSSSTM
jgi:hypothetical protein